MTTLLLGWSIVYNVNTFRKSKDWRMYLTSLDKYDIIWSLSLKWNKHLCNFALHIRRHWVPVFFSEKWFITQRLSVVRLIAECKKSKLIDCWMQKIIGHIYISTSTEFWNNNYKSFICINNDQMTTFLVTWLQHNRELGLGRTLFPAGQTKTCPLLHKTFCMFRCWDVDWWPVKGTTSSWPLLRNLDLALNSANHKVPWPAVKMFNVRDRWQIPLKVHDIG